MTQDKGDHKPGSVPPQLQAVMIIHLGQALPTASSDRTRRLPGEQPVSHLIPPRFLRDEPKMMGTPPYLVLLRVGFAESRCHHRDWCALTAPFHPYQGGTMHSGRPFRAWAWRFVFCGTFLRVTPTGRYPAPCSAEPGLSSPRLGSGERSSGLLRPEKIGVM